MVLTPCIAGILKAIRVNISSTYIGLHPCIMLQLTFPGHTTDVKMLRGHIYCTLSPVFLSIIVNICTHDNFYPKTGDRVYGVLEDLVVDIP